MPHVTLALILGQVLVFLAANTQQSDVLLRVDLNRDLVLQGEWWRVITYVFTPPGMSLLWAAIFWWVFYMMGTALENTWGTFRYNLYLLVGWLGSTIAGVAIPQTMPENLFLQLSVFFAFARLYPDYQFLLFFIIPIKVKWLALFQAVMYAVLVITGDWPTRVLVLSSLMNYLLFFGAGHIADLRADARRKSYQAKAKPAGRLRHACAVCGRNSEEEPGVAFRYCSKCAGGVCYCPDHLHDHEHVAAE
ncbi:hypothetical protein KOR34_45460 [Posidoniimonas corsicana]|uniref:Peptidase S54 rhomboid domain-containing protein n=1 Tax=Posidoniimonas corsicana TaxID=1938618 RepID=A0A5C5UZW8_9BACT|nr:hypothetical protein KOR34_45460 [Posidoniimonas corsicana]